MADNIFEQRNRARKVAKLVSVLDATHASTDAVRAMTDEEWQTAAETAGVHPPSDTTRGQVIDLLASREQPVDPFEDLDHRGWWGGDAA